MKLLTDEKIKELKEKWLKYPFVDVTCIGCSACCMVAGDIFTMSDEWMSVVLEQDIYDEDIVWEAIWVCPVNCISFKS